MPEWRSLTIFTGALDDNDNDASFINPRQRRDYGRLPGGIDSKILPEGIISVDAVKAAAMAHFQEHKIHNRNWNQHVPDIDHIDKSLERKKYMTYQHQSYYEEHGEPSRRLAARRIRQSRAHPAGVSRGGHRTNTIIEHHGDGTKQMKTGPRFEEFSTDNINMQMEIARKRAVKMMQNRKKHHIHDRSRRHSSIAMTFFKGDGCFGTGADGVPKYFSNYGR